MGQSSFCVGILSIPMFFFHSGLWNFQREATPLKMHPVTSINGGYWYQVDVVLSMDLGNSLYEKIGSLWIQGIYGYPSAITFESDSGQSHVNGGVDGNRIYQLASFLSIVSLAYQRFKNHMTHMFSAFIFGSFECWSSNHLTERTRIPNSMHRQATCRWLPAIPKATPDARCFAQRFGL
jgi:hypothetical protein